MNEIEKAWIVNVYVCIIRYRKLPRANAVYIARYASTTRRYHVFDGHIQPTTPISAHWCRGLYWQGRIGNSTLMIKLAPLEKNRGVLECKLFLAIYPGLDGGLGATLKVQMTLRRSHVNDSCRRWAHQPCTSRPVGI